MPETDQRAAVLDAVAMLLCEREPGHPLRVGVDGVTSSGKSTFADELAAAVVTRGRPAIRVTMDGFHHPRAHRYRQGRMSADGYYEDAYDFAAAVRELLAPLGAGGDLHYRSRVIDLASDEPITGDWLVAAPGAVLVLDGSFVQRAELRGHLDEVVWLDVPFDVAFARGVGRETAAMGRAAAEEAFRRRYHAAGRRYLREVDPARRADIVVDNTDLAHPVLRRPATPVPATTRRTVPAGDMDYERHGAGYAALRRPDPSIAALVLDALGDARTVLNVGAGAGSYEPTDRLVLAVEPAAAMRAQRPTHLVPAIDATAERLPFDDDSFDAALASITVHQWTDPDAGLRELRRIARGPVVILTFDADALNDFWLVDYAPDVIETERRRFPPVEHIAEVLGGDVDIVPVPVPRDCPDGFGEAYYARPEEFLRPEVRAAQSGWVLADQDAVARAVERLAADLASGEWDRRYGPLRRLPARVGAVRLIVARP